MNVDRGARVLTWIEATKRVGQLDRALWTVIVAAAGKGTRLGWDKPKILYPVDGRTILERLAEAFSAVAESFVFVLSPAGAPLVNPSLETLLRGRFRVTIQTEALGMADAVAKGLPLVSTPYVAVVWGDQAGLRAESMVVAARLLQNARFVAACPTIECKRPYIHFVRTANGRIARVLQAREGDAMPEIGESDAGVFFFRTEALRHCLARYLLSGEGRGARTRELNFLPLLQLIDRIPPGLVSISGLPAEESVGVNSQEDAQRLTELIKRRPNHARAK